MIKVILESLDGDVITPRTGKSRVNATTSLLPTENSYQFFMYEDEDCESPGVAIETNNVERIGNEIRFFDHGKRPFKIIIKEDNEEKC